MIESKKIEEQLNFFDYIYPTISNRLDELERNSSRNFQKIVELKEERKYLLLTIEQYKNKIQRIEQFLIKHGLIKLLGSDSYE